MSPHLDQSDGSTSQAVDELKRLPYGRMQKRKTLKPSFREENTINRIIAEKDKSMIWDAHQMSGKNMAVEKEGSGWTQPLDIIGV